MKFLLCATAGTLASLCVGLVRASHHPHASKPGQLLDVSERSAVNSWPSPPQLGSEMWAVGVDDTMVYTLVLPTKKTAADGTGKLSNAPSRQPRLKTDETDATVVGESSSAAVAAVDAKLESVIQDALLTYRKIGKLALMGGEKGLRYRMNSYGDGLPRDDIARVTRADDFLNVVKNKFRKLLDEDEEF